MPMIQEIQVERTLFHLVEFQLSNQGNRESVYHHLLYQNDNLQIETRVEKSSARVHHSFFWRNNRILTNLYSLQMEYSEHLICLDL